MTPRMAFTRVAPRHVRRWLVGAVVVGFAVRLYLAWTAVTIARDGVIYVTMARSMAGDMAAAIAERLHFGYPLLVWLLHAVIAPLSDEGAVLAWQHAAQLVAVLAGTVSIALVYWLGYLVHSRRAGLLAAWTWALMPRVCAMGADALSDMPHLALVFGGLGALMVGLRHRRFGLLVVAGLCSGAAYAIRPEGGEIAAVAVGLIVLMSGWTWPSRALGVVAVCGGFAVLGGAYIWAEGGAILSKKPWMFESKPAVSAVGPLMLADAAGMPREVVGAAIELVRSVSVLLHHTCLALAMTYVVLPLRRGLRRGWWRAPAVLIGLHAVVLSFLHIRHGYVSHRHVLLLGAAAVILHAAFLVDVVRYLPRSVRRWRLDAAVIAVLVVALLPRTLAGINGNRWHIREAAEWIRAQAEAGAPPLIVAEHGLVPFYAGLGDWVPCAELDHLPLVGRLPDARWFVWDARETPPERVTVLERNRCARLTEVRRFVDADGTGLVFYRVSRCGGADPSPGSAGVGR